LIGRGTLEGFLMSPELFIRKVCHDLRAPLRALKEIPTWLEEDLAVHLQPVPEAALELLQMMRTQADRLDGIVAGLSELAKLRRTEEQPRVDLETVLSKKDWPEQLRLNFDISFLPLEPEHARLVVDHLVDNAFKHAKAAEHYAELTVCRVERGVRIAVSDVGPGIDPKHFETVYEPLSTLKSRDDCEGSGMGLAVVARIAELYGGTCALLPNAGGAGVTSEIIVPVAPPGKNGS